MASISEGKERSNSHFVRVVEVVHRFIHRLWKVGYAQRYPQPVDNFAVVGAAKSPGLRGGEPGREKEFRSGTA